MKIRRRKGCGWNKRQRASNNYVKAIADGAIPSTYLSVILDVRESVIEKIARGKYHHVAKSRSKKTKFLRVKTIHPDDFNIDTYIKILAKDYEISLESKGLSYGRRKEMKHEYIATLESNPSFSKEYISVMQKIYKAIKKLQNKYCSHELELVA